MFEGANYFTVFFRRTEVLTSNVYVRNALLTYDSSVYILHNPQCAADPLVAQEVTG